MNWNIEAVLRCLAKMHCHEVDDLGRVLPGPHSEHLWSIHGGSVHVVVHKGVEVLVRHRAHLPPKTSHLELGLVVHLSNELLSKPEFPVELLLFVSSEIGPLLYIKVRIGQTNLRV